MEQAARQALQLDVDGMSCQHCVRAVRHALDGVPGVEIDRVEVGHVAVHYDPARTTSAAIGEAIRDAGYEPGAAVEGGGA
ncbi:MAG: cation transporter [Gemmatimonadaceae bacterium]|nr:cation transporter [Gemmatimonadaceae bacterium]